MLDKIKSLLGKKTDASQAAQTNSKFITDKDQIKSLLVAAAHHRLVCDIDLSQVVVKDEEAGDDEAFSQPTATPAVKIATYIHKVGTERAALEKLSDMEQQVRLLAAEQFKIHIDMYGTPLTFQTKINTIQAEAEKEYYIFDLPEKIYYPLNKDNRRLKVTGTKIPVYLKFPEIGKTLPSMLDDIGTKGMSLILSTKGVNLPSIKKQDVLRSCGINSSFGNGTFDLQVTEVKEFEAKSIIRLNCSYIDLSKDVQGIVDALIGSLEQVTIKK